MSRIPAISSCLVLAFAMGCSESDPVSGEEAVFVEPFAVSSLLDGFGSVPLGVRAETDDGRPVSGGILRVQLRRGGTVGFPMDSEGRAFVRFPEQAPLDGTLWISMAPSQRIGAQGQWRESSFAGRVVVTRR